MTNLEKIKWNVVADSVELARQASEKILRDARLAITQRDRFNIVLAGGNTPMHTYRYMSRQDSDWARWHIFFGDERCVPRDDPQRNSLPIINGFINDVAIPEQQVNYMLAESGFDVAVSDYEKKIRHALPFDLVLLGMGEDGHTASLFPGHEFDEKAEVVGVRNAPKPPADRVSLNYSTINDARKILILIEGENKRPAVEAWLAGEDLPIAGIFGRDATDVYIDASAYPR